MSKKIIRGCVVAVVFSFGLSAQGAEGGGKSAFDFSGDLRLRHEVRRDFKFGADAPANDEDFLLTRMRVKGRWQATESIHVLVEGQSAEIIAESDINEDAFPTVFSDSFDLHRGYIEGTFSPSMPIRIRAGRQKLNLGAKRLSASLEWVNTARVWDAVRVTLGGPKTRTVDIFASRVVPVDPNRFNDWTKTKNPLANSFFHGVYLTDKTWIPGATLDLYWFYREESDAEDQVHTLGTRFAGNWGALDADGELAAQFGTYRGVDHLSYAVHGGAGYTIEEAKGLRLGAIYNYARGDDDPNDETHKTFDNLFPLNHAYYGYMDFFAWQNMHEATATATVKPMAGTKLRVAYHHFWLAEEDTDAWYNAPMAPIRQATEDVDPNVGGELDVTLSAVLLQKRLNVLVGYGHFFPNSYMDQTGPSEEADFFFVQSLLRF